MLAVGSEEAKNHSPRPAEAVPQEAISHSLIARDYQNTARMIGEVGIDFIQKTVADYYSIQVDELKDKTRKKEIVIARQVSMYFCKDFTNHSLKSIGYHFGGRDHSTVIHAIQTVNDIMETDTSFRNAVNELKKKFKMRSY